MAEEKNKCLKEIYLNDVVIIYVLSGCQVKINLQNLEDIIAYETQIYYYFTNWKKCKSEF